MHADSSTIPLRVLAWNIQHGGGRRVPEIVMSLVEHDCDVVVLSEFRPQRGGQIRGALYDQGFRAHATTPGTEARNGILIASRPPLERLSVFDGVTGPLRERLLAVRLKEHGCSVIACHLPDASDQSRKLMSWRHLHDAAAELSKQRTLIIGDFNAGRRRHDTPHDSGSYTSADGARFGKLAAMGYVDPLRLDDHAATAPTWTSHTGTDHRLDHALVSESLAQHPVRTRYSQAERSRKLSDHTPQIVELELPRSGAAELPEVAEAQETLLFKGQTPPDRLADQDAGLYKARVPEGMDLSKLSKRS